MSHEGLAPAARERDFEDELPDRNRLAGLASSLRKQKFAMLGLAILMVVMLMALTAPVISPMSPTAHSLSRVLKPPMWNGEGHVFILGTDHLGRDLLSRIIYGARLTLQIGVIAVGISLSCGLLLGLVAGLALRRARRS